jgi:hypothetical protein
MAPRCQNVTRGRVGWRLERWWKRRVTLCSSWGCRHTPASTRIPSHPVQPFTVNSPPRLPHGLQRPSVEPSIRYHRGRFALRSPIPMQGAVDLSCLRPSHISMNLGLHRIHHLHQVRRFGHDYHVVGGVHRARGNHDGGSVDESVPVPFPAWWAETIMEVAIVLDFPPGALPGGIDGRVFTDCEEEERHRGKDGSESMYM